MSVIAHRVQIDNICRTCLAEEQNMKSVFDTDSSLGEGLQLFQMLMDCTSLQVTENDGLPVQMCLSCINNIARSFTFKKRCEASDSTLRKLLRNATITDDEPLIELKPPAIVALCSQETDAASDRDPLDIQMEFEEGETNMGELLSSENANIDCEKNDIETMDNVEQLEPQTIQSAYDYDRKPDEIKREIMHDPIDLESNASIIDNENSMGSSVMPDESEQPIYRCEECLECFITEDDLKIHADTHRDLTNHKCSACSREYASANDLAKHMKVHDLANGNKPHVCSECGKGFKYRSKLKVHSRMHTGETPYPCNVCGKRFKQSFDVTRHMRTHPTNATGQLIYRCKKCKACFKVESDLESHKIDKHGKKTLHKCHVCSEAFDRARLLTTHMKKVHDNADRPHVCGECGERFYSPVQLRTHSRKHTSEKPPFVCKLCDKEFKRAYSLIKHRSVLHASDYICAECGTVFKNRKIIIAHLREHAKNKTHTCDICDKEFNHPTSWATHMKMHAGVRDNICSYCGKGFAARRYLYYHERIHTGERPYICNVCGKGFLLHSYLSEHARTHSGERPHVCNVCDRGFVNKSKLRRHMRVHTGERPYKCHLCPNAYTDSQYLKQHIQKHTGRAPYLCDHCEKVYYDAYSLKIHLRVHTGERPHACTICDKSFTQAGTLAKHLKTH